MRKIVIFGCPFDRTSSYRKGSRLAPGSIRKVLQEIEDYSPFLKKDLRDIRFFDAGDLPLSGNSTEKALNRIRKAAQKILGKGDIPFAVGGEHLVTLPVVQAVKEKHRDLKVFCIDAHCDLKDEYRRLRLSHATVSRRLLELVGQDSFFLFGARSGEREEFEFAGKKGILYGFSPKELHRALRQVKGSPLYISVDLDIFDPGVFPGTGVPEPGGIDFPKFTEFLRHLGPEARVVGMDITELAPCLDRSESSSFLAATVLRELLLTV